MISLSPSVTIREIDLTNVVPAVATSIGGAVIDAVWGPVAQVTTIDSENVLVQRFGKPQDGNAASWFTPANFLAYSTNCLVVRTDSTNQRNSVAALTYTLSSIPVTAGGTGYTASGTGACSIAIDPPPVAGKIKEIAIASGGEGYGTVPTVVIPAPPVGGTQAVGTAVLGSGGDAGKVVRIIVTNGGSGYLTAPTVTLTGGTPTTPAVVGASVLTLGGTTATATPIVTAGAISGFDITNPGSGYYASIDPTSAYYNAPSMTLTHGAGTGATVGVAALVLGGIKINNENVYSMSFEDGQAVVGEFAAKYPGAIGNSLRVSMCDSTSFSTWTYKDLFDAAPDTSTYAANNSSVGDEIHLVIIDKDGKWSGIAGTVLEQYSYLSKASDARKEDGASAYYKTVLNDQSKYIWWTDHPSAGLNWGTPASAITYTPVGPITRDMAGGVDHLTSTEGQKLNAFALYNNDEELDVNLLMCGKATATIANYVVQNIAEVRKDCIAFVSPQNVVTGDPLIGNTSDLVDKMVAYRNLLPSSSYMVIDSGYKYQYDRYNDKYRWVPLNGDIAGLCARTDETNDPWWSPGGLNRGGIKNVVKLAFSPRRTDRDNLYKNGINPVVAFPGQGVVLYGDKTGLSKPSAFDRINVRRLFITLEKAIATAAKFQLFEFNDEITRANFVATVVPFLRDVKGRRGISDYNVVCDTTNNTQQVIDTNRFVASIFVAPTRSINFIELNFVATRSGVSFSEVAGVV
jgi:hypothetical protein